MGNGQHFYKVIRGPEWRDEYWTGYWTLLKELDEK